MQPQILRVDDIEESIRENGLKFYVDRLIQDRMGEYYWVETHDVTDECECPKLGYGWKLLSLKIPDDTSYEMRYYHYKIYKIPKGIAWFCIDALKLQSQIMGIGNGEYDGPHGGDIQYFIKDGDQFKEIPVKAVRVETL